jgi:hypothetical protein
LRHAPFAAMIHQALVVQKSSTPNDCWCRRIGLPDFARPASPEHVLNDDRRLPHPRVARNHNAVREWVMRIRPRLPELPGDGRLVIQMTIVFQRIFDQELSSLRMRPEGPPVQRHGLKYSGLSNLFLHISGRGRGKAPGAHARAMMSLIGIQSPRVVSVRCGIESLAESSIIQLYLDPVLILKCLVSLLHGAESGRWRL